MIIVFADIIEELITKGQQLDAVNFAYEAGLQEKFPPAPLLKAYLEDSKKIPSNSDNLSTSTGQSGVSEMVLYNYLKSMLTS